MKGFIQKAPRLLEASPIVLLPPDMVLELERLYPDEDERNHTFNIYVSNLVQIYRYSGLPQQFRDRLLQQVEAYANTPSQLKLWEEKLTKPVNDGEEDDYEVARHYPRNLRKFLANASRAHTGYALKQALDSNNLDLVDAYFKSSFRKSALEFLAAKGHLEQIY